MERTRDAKRETQAIDWEDVRQRMNAASAALEELGELEAGELEKIWARRAAALAKLPTQDEEGTQVELLLIELGRETYGLEARYVVEIRPVEHITRVPRVPGWVAGVANLRGRILSVIDLRRLFGLTAAEEDREGGWSLEPIADARNGGTRVLAVVETSDMEVALLVDDVIEVATLPASRIRDSADVVRGLPPEYVRGLAERRGSNGSAAEDGGKRMIVVLDLPAMLADERLVIHEEVV